MPTNVSALFPSRWIRAADLQGTRPVVTIARWAMEPMSDDKNADNKPVLYFQGKQKGLVLNKTNAQVIESFLGSDIDAWIGHQIQLFTAKVRFQGGLVDALRVEMPALNAPRPATRAQAPPPRPAPAPPPDDFPQDDGDPVPF